MGKIRLAIIGTSDIAFRRFLPALISDSHFEYIGVATRDKVKGERFVDGFGGKIFEGYETAINSKEIDALYIPLPPALHYEWGMKALEAGKHIMLEKPFTTSKKHTDEIVQMAVEKGLSIHENYMFMFHEQMAAIRKIIRAEGIGKIRLVRASFGFPHRGMNDFRYNKKLGGGAVLDCGGYPVKLVSSLLGKTTKVVTSSLYIDESNGVDIYGNATLENSNGQVGQIAFGMDNSYKCQLEVWGSEGEIIAPRIFTAPAEFEASIILTKKGETTSIKIPKDDQFKKSIEHFYDAINDKKILESNIAEIYLQSKLVDNLMCNSKLYRLE